jgi:hypothetical protein
MTVSSLTTSVTYVGNGVTTAFPVTFPFFEITVEEIILGVVTKLTGGSDYTVSGGEGSTGTVVISPAPASGTTIRIRRTTDRRQLVDYVENDPFPAETHEKALDRAHMIIQELDAALGGAGDAGEAIVAPAGEDPAFTLPAAATRANKFLQFDGSGNVTTTDVDVSAFNEFIPDGDGAVARTVQSKLRDFVSVKDFGVVGDGTTDDRAAIQAALDGGNKLVYFTAGDYRIVAGYLRVYSNTTLWFHPDARIINDISSADWIDGSLFLNGPLEGETEDGGYDNTENIHFVGGTFDGTPRANAGYMTAFVNFAHSKNMSFVGCRFVKHSGNTHAIEFSGCKDILVDRCHFSGYDPQAASLGTREYINIDQSTESGFPWFGPWDDVACEDITIRGCTFDGGDVAVGSHADAPVNPNKRISFIDNIIRNGISRGLNILRWEEFVIRGNYIGGSATSSSNGIRMVGCLHGDVCGNTIEGFPGTSVNLDDTTGGVKSENVHVTHNRFKGCGGFFIQNTRDCVVAFNQYLDVTEVGTNIYSNLADCIGLVLEGNKFPIGITGKNLYSDIPFAAGARITIDGTTFLYCADDAAVSLDHRGNAGQGMVAIYTASSATSAVPRGFYFIRSGTGEEIVLGLDKYNSTNVAETTGALTGTTGSDGATTVSATDRKIYIENRSGAGRIYAVRFL